MHFQLDHKKLKEEVKKLDLKTLKSADDIFDRKEIKLNTDFGSDEPNYLELRKAKIKAQLYINNFGNYQNFHNCQQFMGDQSIGDDNHELMFIDPPNEDEVIDVLCNYAVWFLKTRQAENRSILNNILGSNPSVNLGAVRCSMCDNELVLYESACSVCEEPVFTTIDELIGKHNSEGMRESSTNRREENYCNGERDCYKSLPKREMEPAECAGHDMSMSDLEGRSHRNSATDIGALDSYTQSPQVSSCRRSSRTSSESSSRPRDSWGGQQQQAHASLYSPQSGHHEAAYSSFNLHANSADTGHPVTVTARNNQCCNDGVAEPLDNPIASDSHNNQGVSTLPGDINIDRVGSGMNSANGWRCESCGMQNDESFLSCQACSVARVTKWTCVYCNIDYKVSIRKCAQCYRDWEGAPKRRFCAWCRENEVLGNGVCEDCAATQWRCWRSGCQERNYGRGHYCGYCGVDKYDDKTPGQPIRVLRNGQIDTKWICSQCGTMNDMSVTQCRSGQCRGARYPTGTSSVSTGYPIGQPGKEVIINDARPEPAPRDSLYPSVSAFTRTELWACKQCGVDNQSSSNTCIGCGKSRFCLRCGLEENIEEGLCAACVAARWRCWYRPCESANFGADKQNCEECGLARQAPRVSGESLWRNVHGLPRLVWVCDRCWRINSNYSSSCCRYECRKERNKDFVWCYNCGFGNPSKWFDWVYKKCKACDRSV